MSNLCPKMTAPLNTTDSLAKLSLLVLKWRQQGATLSLACFTSCFPYGLLTRKEKKMKLSFQWERSIPSYLAHKAFSCGIWGPGVSKPLSCVCQQHFIKSKLEAWKAFYVIFFSQRFLPFLFIPVFAWFYVWRGVLIKYVSPYVSPASQNRAEKSVWDLDAVLSWAPLPYPRPVPSNTSLMFTGKSGFMEEIVLFRKFMLKREGELYTFPLQDVSSCSIGTISLWDQTRSLNL